MTQAQQDSPIPGILKMSREDHILPVALVYLCRAGVHKGEGHDHLPEWHTGFR